MKHNPLTDPQPGDTVVANIRGEYVTRTVEKLAGIFIVYQHSGYVRTQTCSFKTWRGWCKRHKAEVVKE